MAPGYRIGTTAAIAREGHWWYISNMDERLLLPLSRPPRLILASPASAHGGKRPPEAYRLHRLWCLNLYQGQGELRWRGRTFPIRPGSVSLTAPDTDHSYRYRHETTITWLHFLPDPSGDAAALPLMQSTGARFPAILNQAQSAASCCLDHPERAQALLWSLLWQLADSETPTVSPTPAPVRRAMAHADQHLDAPLTAGDLARVGGCSITHLNRLFRTRRGCAAMAWLRRRRLERAQHLLRCSTLSVGRIASDLGFVDLQHFSKALRRATGRSPRALRAEGGDVPETAGAGYVVLEA